MIFRDGLIFAVCTISSTPVAVIVNLVIRAIKRFARINHSLGEGLRSLLGKIVSDTTVNGPVRIFPGDLLAYAAVVPSRMRRTIRVSLKGDRGYSAMTGPTASASVAFQSPIWTRLQLDREHASDN